VRTHYLTAPMMTVVNGLKRGIATECCVVPYTDYEIFLGPIPLFDWECLSEFDVHLAYSQIAMHGGSPVFGELKYTDRLQELYIEST